jgi:hypothetical protein
MCKRYVYIFIYILVLVPPVQLGTLGNKCSTLSSISCSGLCFIASDTDFRRSSSNVLRYVLAGVCLSFRAMTMTTPAFWNVMACCLVQVYLQIRQTFCLHRQGERHIPEDTILLAVSFYSETPTEYTPSHKYTRFMRIRFAVFRKWEERWEGSVIIMHTR